MNTVSIAYGQYQYGNSSSNVTPQQLEECKTLGIKPEKCTEMEILKHHCLGPNSSGCDNNSYRLPELDPIVLSILVGSGIALVTGTLYVRKIRKARKKD